MYNCFECSKYIRTNEHKYYIKELLNTSFLVCYCCNECYESSLEKNDFLRKYTCIQTSTNYTYLCDGDLLGFLLSNFYYMKIFSIDLLFNKLRLFDYIYTILNKKHKNDFEEKFITDCCYYRLIQIEKIY